MILISHRSLYRSAVGLLMLGAGFGSLRAQEPDREAEGRRLADVVSIAVSEYVEGVVGGEVVRVEELTEARLFLEQARRAAERLGPEAGPRIAPILDGLLQAVNELRPEAELRAGLTALRAELESVLGVSLDLFPAAPPSLARGAAVYQRSCLQCHGESGAGGPLAPSLDPRPADLSDHDALRSTSVVDFYRKVNVGVAGTAMPGFAAALDLDDRWAVALYAATLRYPQLDPAYRDVMTVQCSECLLLLSDFQATASMSDDSLAVVLTARMSPTPRDSEWRALTGYARAAAARELLGGDRALRASRVVARSKATVDAAVAAVRAGNRQLADTRAMDAYLIFEEIETQVRARDAGAASRVEAAFAEFRAALAVGSGVDQAATRREVSAALDGALDRLIVGASGFVLFSQSLVIMLREGLEAILIIGALVAFLTKAGAEQQKREIGWGVLAALGASGITAVGLATLFRSATAHQEALEGITMLVAAAVLFWVSYWLVSKIEVRKWQEFVRSQMQRALTSKRSFALVAVAFLAVYREGFETVLFYAALFTSADGAVGGMTAIVAGMAVGAAALGAVYYLMQRYGVRLPLKPFFAITSTLLYVMAFSFAGQGVAELQAAGVISMTPLDWLPSLPILGIFPTLQTIASQLVLALALGAALLWVFWLEPRTVRPRMSG